MLLARPRHAECRVSLPGSDTERAGRRGSSVPDGVGVLSRRLWRVRTVAMNYRQSSARLAEYRRQIADLRTKIRETRAATDPEEVADYVFTTATARCASPSCLAASPI